VGAPRGDTIAAVIRGGLEQLGDKVARRRMIHARDRDALAELG